MEQKIIDLLNNHSFNYISIPNESLENIHELLTKNKTFEPMTDTEMLYMGVYYRWKNNFDDMLKYYQMAFDHKNTVAAINLARYYSKMRNYDVAIKYYLMYIENEFNIMKNILVKCYMELALCYMYVSNHDGVIKYYLLAFEDGNVEAMNDLAHYCESRSDYDNMIKYCLVALECGSESSYFKITRYYLNNNIENFFDERFFVYLRLTQSTLGNLFRKIKIMYYNKIKLLIEHFKYLPGAEGFMIAKLEFERNKIRKIQ